MTELELIVNFYKNTDRQGQGSSVETKKALDLIDLDKEQNLKIADIG